MGHNCSYCKKELNKGDSFILDGHYPGFGDRVLARTFYFIDDLDDYGKIFHRDCFFKKLDKEKFSKYKK